MTTNFGLSDSENSNNHKICLARVDPEPNLGEKYQWISQHLGPRRLKSYPARTQKGRSGQLGRWIPSLCLSPTKGPLLFTKTSVGIFSYFMPNQWPCAGPSTEGAWPTAAFSPCLLWTAPSGFSGIFYFSEAEAWPGRASRFTSKTCPSSAAAAPPGFQEGLAKGPVVTFTLPQNTFLCPSWFWLRHSWPRTRRQTLEQTFPKSSPVSRALQGTGWRFLRTTPTPSPTQDNLLSSLAFLAQSLFNVVLFDILWCLFAGFGVVSPALKTLWGSGFRFFSGEKKSLCPSQNCWKVLFFQWLPSMRGEKHTKTTILFL